MTNMTRLVLVLVLFLYCKSDENVLKNDTAIHREMDVAKAESADVFRQLLNQETIIRLSLKKTVQAIKKDLLIVKQGLLTLNNDKKEMKRKLQILDKDNMNLKQRLGESKNTLKEFNENFRKVNENFEKVRKNASDMTDNYKNCKMRTETNMNDFKNKIADALTDRNTEISYTFIALSHIEKRNFDIEKTIPVLMDNKMKAMSHLLNKTIENRTEDSLKLHMNVEVRNVVEDVNMKILKIQRKQVKLANAVSSLQLFRMNISNIVKEILPTFGFTAAITSSHSSWSGSILIFPKIITNIGGAYNNSTGIFTSPIDGNFVIYLSIVSYGTDSIHLDIKLNGSSKVRLYLYDGYGYEAGSNHVILHLRKGDRVWIQRYSGDGYYSESVPLMTFSGFMI